MVVAITYRSLLLSNPRYVDVMKIYLARVMLRRHQMITDIIRMEKFMPELKRQLSHQYPYEADIINGTQSAMSVPLDIFHSAQWSQSSRSYAHIRRIRLRVTLTDDNKHNYVHPS